MWQARLRMIINGRWEAPIRAILVVLAVGLAYPAPGAVAEEVGANRADLIRSLLPTVVNITVRKDVPTETQTANASASSGSATDATKTFVGSGFIIDPSGLIVTNEHVVDGAYEITVTLSDGTVLPGELLHASRTADLAVVKVKAGHPLTPVKWGNSNKLKIGDQVFAIGNPLGIGTSVSGGIVSGLNRDVEESPYDDYIQTDAAINHGNSGGPLFDMEGHVVGVDTAMVSPTQASAGLGLAIPSDDVQFVVGRLIKYGWVAPGWIGVKVQQVTREIAEAMGKGSTEGSVVSWTIPGGPASKAGIAVGDVIIRYGDDTPSDERALLRDITQTPIGDTVKLVVLRGDTEVTLPVTVDPWPRSQWDERDVPMTPARPKLTIPPGLGLSLATIQKSERAKLGLEDGLNGVLITGVLPGSDAARRGAVAGDVILRVQDTPVATPSDVQRGLLAVRGEKRPFVMMLVLPKVRKVPGPRWVTLRVSDSEG